MYFLPNPWDVATVVNWDGMYILLNVYFIFFENLSAFGNLFHLLILV